MKTLRRPLALLCLIYLPTSVLNAQSGSGPADRQLTDPKSVASVAQPNPRPISIEALFGSRLIDSAALSPNGEEVAITTNLSGRNNLWKVSATGYWPIQLASSDDRQTTARWSHDGHRIAYAQDKGGNELWDIYIVGSDGGAPVNLTATPDIREEHPVWSSRDDFIACAYKPKDSPSYDIAIIDVVSHKLRKLTEEKNSQYTWDVIGFSPDDHTLYANRKSIDDGDVYSLDFASATLTNLTAHAGKVLNSGSDVSPDGRSLLLTSNQKYGSANAAVLDLSTHRLRWASDTRWEVLGGAFSPDSKSFTFIINADGRRTIYRADLAHLHSRELKLPAGYNSLVGPQHFSPDGNRILVDHEALNTPNDLWIFDARTDTARQLTYMAPGGITAQSLPPSQLVHYRSFDGSGGRVAGRGIQHGGATNRGYGDVARCGIGLRKNGDFGLCQRCDFVVGKREADTKDSVTGVYPLYRSPEHDGGGVGQLRRQSNFGGRRAAAGFGFVA